MRAVLRVNFGDEVSFTFHDGQCLKSPDGMDVTKTARIHFGANGEQAAFSKVFTDPEMAVKTRFLMSEALFEMAKEHRKLKQEDKAKEEVAQGKRTSRHCGVLQRKKEKVYSLPRPLVRLKKVS